MKGRVVHKDNIKDFEKEAMFSLLQNNFDGVSRTQFEDDLVGKNWVILLEDGEDIQGFSTIQKYTDEWQGERFNVIFSGDTIINQNAWGGFSLPKTWISTINSLCSDEPGIKTYWLLITSGFRTYRFLPVFWKTFYPSFREDMASDVKDFINFLAMRQFGNEYDSEEGIVRFKNPQALKRELLDVEEGRKNNPHIKFFLDRNPGFVNGDELVCLTELSPTNLTRAGERMVNG